MHFTRKATLFGILLPMLVIAACGSVSTQSGSPTATPIANATSTATSSGPVSIIIRAQQASVDPYSKAPINVTCDASAGEQLIGGGFALGASTSDFHVMESYPSDVDTWTVYPRNTTASVQQAAAYSICVKNAPPLRRYIVTGTPVTYNSSESTTPEMFATASCGSDIGTSGGFYFSPTGHDGSNDLSPDGSIRAMAPMAGSTGPLTSDNTWQISGWFQPEASSGPSSVDMTPVVYCVGAEHLRTTNFPGHSGYGGDITVITSATECSADSLLIGGFFGLDEPNDWNVWQLGEQGLSFSSMLLTRWVVSVHGTSTTLGLKAGAICATFY